MSSRASQPTVRETIAKHPAGIPNKRMPFSKASLRRALACMAPLGAFLALACGGAPDTLDFCVGAEHCACAVNATCNAGLVCVKTLCVAPETTATSTSSVLLTSTFSSSSGSSSFPSSSSSSSSQTFASMIDAGSSDASPATDHDTGSNPDATVTYGVNLITNGDFSQGTGFWTVTNESGNQPVNPMLVDGGYCVDIDPSDSVVIGWPADPSRGAELVGGVSYALTYSAWTSRSGVSIDAKVGQVKSPYSADFETTDDVQTQSRTFSHTFVAAMDDVVGVAFAPSVSGGGGTATGSTFMLCIADVSLVASM
jgi:hypothetical protein